MVTDAYFDGLWSFEGMPLRFDGVEPAFIVEENPLAGCAAFTLEALFRPVAGGGFEQRFVHVQADHGQDRALLELRCTPRGWYGDVFVKTGEAELALNDARLLHLYGEWHTLALICTGTQLMQAVNGSIELTGELAGGSIGEGRVSLGWRINGVSPFHGEISRVRFARRALEAGQLMRPDRAPASP